MRTKAEREAGARGEGVASQRVSRRRALGFVGAALSTAPLMQLLGCGSASTTTLADAGAGAGGSAGEGPASAAGGGWASGGTVALAELEYADPFASGLGSACVLTCAATLGPCYAETLERSDISEGSPGLPTRLLFLVVDETCAPIPGATVDIWHTSATGLYSGDDADAFCTLNDAAATQARWFRGVQTTDARGRVEFKTCFPGWYSSRTIHIHFTVRVNGEERVTSQLFFDDSLTDEILHTQPIYADRGERDTTNQNDGVISADEVASYSFGTRQLGDGSLLAYKALVIRSTTSAALCSVSGGAGGGGPGGPGGGPPPGGFDGGFPPRPPPAN